MKIALFAYNFEHKKTQDVIFYLLASGFQIDIILAADPVQLNIPPSSVKTKIKHDFLIHPREIAKNLKIPYEVVKHNSSQTMDILTDRQIDLGVISGARILKSDTIAACKLGILNLHPALLPECRGLDSLLWSVEKNIDLGVTGHLIEKQVDSGKIVVKEKLKIVPNDSILEVNERLYDLQLSVLIKSIGTLQSKTADLEVIDLSFPNYGKMTVEQEHQALAKFDQYIADRT